MASQIPANENVGGDPNYKPPPGRLGNLTVEQQAKLDLFKKQLKDEGIFVESRMDDALLLRFLRARKFDLPQAKLMISNWIKWRKDQGVDDLLKTFQFPEKNEVDRIYPQYYHKTDKEGRPVYIERLGSLDFTKLDAITTEDRLLTRLIYEYERFIDERLPACSKAAGHPVETSCTILDISGVSLSNFSRVKNYLQRASKIGSDYYPETMGKFYVINAPFLFSTIWSVIKGYLDPVTAAKIDIIGSGYKDKLLAQIPKENLPKEFGGECACVGGCSLSDAGPWNTIDTPPKP